MILGVDFSLTATGVCAITDGDAECVTVRSKPGESWWMHPLRVRLLADQVADWANDIEYAPAWVVESPSFASKGPGHDKVLSGWWLFVDHLMRERGWDAPLRVAPTRLKKFVTGSGRASKVEVAAAVTRRWPDAHARNDNEFDAVGLAAIGAAAFGEPFNGELTKYQSEVVAAVAAGKEA